MITQKSEYVVCIAILTAKEDKVDELLKVLYELKKLSPKEPGCLRYELHQDEENPRKFTFVDRFRNHEAFLFHCEQDYTKRYFDEIIPSLVESMDITTHREIQLEMK